MEQHLMAHQAQNSAELIVKARNELKLLDQSLAGPPSPLAMIYARELLLVAAQLLYVVEDEVYAATTP
jgi:phytoene/squalene synthetase